ncbi:hypothetical protein [Aquimarina mytili]|uniref:Uncharacterized protein n=1 Tax=Aquimarina mytili TaxID=874423 RepID=A0A937A6S8_9FLAO|nr:hypothetical protein [Aquimarina mytili]MBL0685910.1 hypothetical protein [Aquimarina mytili]
MKTSHNSKTKLTLEKLRITKLDNLDTIKGGALGMQNRANTTFGSDTFGEECYQGDLDLM